ncbi:MAG: hypothetical protein KC609_07255 [Myxococcales bacterium]|nr:hypothetical protein [Myxococcales bacterium]
MKRLLFTIAFATAVMFAAAPTAEAGSVMNEVYTKIRKKSPFHAVVKIERIKKPKLALGVCNVRGRVLRVEKTVNSEWRRLKEIIFGIRCKQPDAYVSPKDPVRWISTERLRRGTVVDAYLVPTGQTGTFKTSKFNMVTILRQTGDRGVRYGDSK